MPPFMSWLSAAIGLVTRSPEAASGFTFFVSFLPYPSSAFVPIDTMPLGIVRLAPKQVTVTGEMGMIAERSFAGIPVETGAGAITSFIVTPARVAVNVRGPEERVLALTRDSLRVVAHITGSSGGIARITVVAPRGITARAFPDSVTLRRRGTPRRG